MKRQLFVFVAILVGTGLGHGRAWAQDKAFAPIPAEQTGGRASGLTMRIVRYQGGTNGAITVEVKNPQAKPATFVAKGMYFVPQGNANSAPQRLGAVGPFQVQTQNGWQREEKLTIGAGETRTMKLDVYCIDSHRSSPSGSTAFRVAKDRVPAKITDQIDREAKEQAAEYGGVAAAGAKGVVQSTVWRNRDKDWVKLDGEGKQEEAKQQNQHIEQMQRSR